MSSKNSEKSKTSKSKFKDENVKNLENLGHV